MVEKVLSENPKQLDQYRGGKTKLQGFFAGQVKFCQINGYILFCWSQGILFIPPPYAPFSMRDYAISNFIIIIFVERDGLNFLTLRR